MQQFQVRVHIQIAISLSQLCTYEPEHSNIVDMLV